MMKAWTALVSMALILIGAAPAAYLLVLLMAQLFTSIQVGSWVALPLTVLFTEPAVLQSGKAAAIVGLVPNLSPFWTAGPDSPVALMWVLNKVHVAALPVLLGLPILGAGALRLRRRHAEIRVHTQQNEDRLRRVRDYQQDDTVSDGLGRREPFISGLSAREPRRIAQG